MAKLPALLDTSVFIAWETGHSLDFEAIPEGSGVSVITVGELELALFMSPTPESMAKRLTTVELARSGKPVPVAAGTARHWASLRARTRGQAQSRINDLWIAATALDLGIPVVTQDRGFERLRDHGGPEVILV
jgi:predicted nucleic acid-binding protein